MKKLILFLLIVLNTNIAINGFINVRVMNFSSKAKVYLNYQYRSIDPVGYNEFCWTLSPFKIGDYRIPHSRSRSISFQVDRKQFIQLIIKINYPNNRLTFPENRRKISYKKIILNPYDLYDGMLIMICDKKDKKGIANHIFNVRSLVKNVCDYFSIITMSDLDFFQYLLQFQ